MANPSSSYSSKLQDPRWQRKRLELFVESGWTCTECQETRKPLHVHHLIYYPGRDPWDYEDNELKVLCFECHEKRADAEKRLALVLGPLTTEEICRVHALFGFCPNVALEVLEMNFRKEGIIP